MQRTNNTTQTSGQWGIYNFIRDRLETNSYLRLLVQASAGTGKSYLVKSILLDCQLRNRKSKATAPTGIAAANNEIEGTNIVSTTLHQLFGLGYDLESKHDFTNKHDPSVAELFGMNVLLIDEGSMITREDCHTQTKRETTTSSVTAKRDNCNAGCQGR